MVYITVKNLDPSLIVDILTLRYNPAPSSNRLDWNEFTTKDTPKNILDLIEQTIADNLINNLQNYDKTAVSLSSGVDSTLVLAILRKTFPNLRIESMSVTFADSLDESPAAKKISEKFETNHHVLYIENFLQHLPKAISIAKLPYWDLHWYYVAEKVKSLSKVFLSGDGGDELFGGYTFRYQKFLSTLKPNSSSLDKAKLYLDCHERDWVPDQNDVFGTKSEFSWEKIYAVLEPFFTNSLPPLSQLFLADYNGKLIYNMLPLYDKFHKHFEIKYLAPILSKELISIATHIPNESKYNLETNTGKILLRQILKKFEVEQLVTEKKQGFSINTTNLWVTTGKKICKYYLDSARTVKDGWINSTWINKYIDKDDLDARYVNKLLGLLAFEVWYRLFVTEEITPEEKLVP